MGGQIEQWLTKQQPVPEKPQLGGEISKFLDQGETQRLGASVQMSEPLKADSAARVLQLKSKTGLPADYISRNLDEVSRESAKADFDPEKFRQYSPSVAKWISEQPEHASVAWGDLPHLSGVEGIVEALVHGTKLGWQQSKQGRLGYEVQQQKGVMTDDQRVEVNRLNRELALEPTGRNFGTYVSYQAAKIFGQMAESLPEVLTKGMTGAMGAATAAAAGGPLTWPMIPWAAGAGFGVGTAYGYAEYTRQIEGGSAYLELSQIKGKEGQPLDPELVQGAATAVGLINAGLEMTGMHFVAAPFISATKKLLRQSVRDALVRPTMRAALFDLGKAYTSAIAGETATEVLQEVSNVFAEEIAKMGSAGEFESLSNSPEQREAAIKRLGDIAAQTAAGMLVLGVPGALSSGAATAVQARRATRREQYFKALGEKVAESETYKKLPEAIQQIVEHATKDGPLENVYIPAEVFNTYWQGKNINPGDVAERVTGNRQQWQEATNTGGDLVIPMAKYASQIAPTEHNTFFAKELRAGPMEMSAREASEAMDKQKQAAEEQADVKGEERKKSAEQVGASIADQLQKAGIGAEASKSYSALYERMFHSLSERTGIDPQELFKRYNLNIGRSDAETEAKASETVLSQTEEEQSIIRRFMAWKGILDDPNVSQAVRNVAWLKVRDIEPHARAIEEERFSEANAEYERRTGQKWMSQGPKNPRVPAHVAAALDTYVESLKKAQDSEDVSSIKVGRHYSCAKHLAEIARHGTFDDVNSFMSQLGDKDVDETGVIGATIFDMVPAFADWWEDTNREPPKLTLMQSSGMEQVAAREIENAMRDLVPDEVNPLVELMGEDPAEWEIKAGVKYREQLLVLQRALITVREGRARDALKMIRDSDIGHPGAEIELLDKVPMLARWVTRGEDFINRPRLSPYPLHDRHIAELELHTITSSEPGGNAYVDMDLHQMLPAFYLDSRNPIDLRAKAIRFHTKDVMGIDKAGERALSDRALVEKTVREFHAEDPEEIVQRFPYIEPLSREFFQEALPSYPAFLSGFHSKAEQIIEQKMPNKAPVEVVRALLKDIKAEERKWLQLDRWLNALEGLGDLDQPVTGLGGTLDFVPAIKDDKVNKEYVLAYLQGHRLLAKEVVLDKASISAGNAEMAYEEAINAERDETIRNDARVFADAVFDTRKYLLFRTTSNGTVTGVSYHIPIEAFYKWLSDNVSMDIPANLNSENKWIDPHFGGGIERPDVVWLANENQAMSDLRETTYEFMHDNSFIESHYTSEAQEVIDEGGGPEWIGEIPYESYTLPGGENYRVVLFTLPNVSPGFTSPHFQYGLDENDNYTVDQPERKNIFAHTRLKDRVGPNGEKVLFVEEIQSDWHQAGRERGYSSEISYRAERADDGRWSVYDSMGNLRGIVTGDTAEEAIQHAMVDARPSGVPDAPFRNTWHEFVFKRLIRMAAEGGYDQIAWTTGEQQNDRYSLEKHVEELRIWENPEELSGFKPDDPNRLVHLEGYNKIGTGADYGRLGAQRIFSETIPLSKLGDYVGKEVAVKLMTQPPRKGRVAVHVEAEIAREFGERTADIVRRFSIGTVTAFDLYSNITSQTGNAVTPYLEKLIDEYKESYDNRPGTRTLKGEELRVGGTGMRGFYDDILPRFANSFGKKYKAKAEDVKVRLGGIYSGARELAPREPGMEVMSEEGNSVTMAEFGAQHGFTLSDEIKQAALKNEFTLYQSAAGYWSKKTPDTKTEIRATVTRNTIPRDQPWRVTWWKQIDKNWVPLEHIGFSSEQNAIKALEHDGHVKVEEQFQTGGGSARGRIRIGEGGINIDLLRNADPSTFIHETGHFYLEVLHDLRDSTPDIRADYDTIRSWLGAGEEGPFSREQHELFARGFEKYLAEGRAPVPALQGAFIRFKVWLLSVYSSLAELNVELTDQVRDVFGRMLASQSEIAMATHGLPQVFTDPGVLGEKKAKAYQDAVQAATAAASEQMAASIIADWKRESSAFYRAEKAKATEEAGNEANDVYTLRARSILTRGTLPNGDPLPEGQQAFKLSRDAILADYGEKTLRDLPKPLVWTGDEKNALHPEMAAHLLGFPSGEALINYLKTSTDPRRWIVDRVREKMRNKRFGLMTDKEVPVEATKAVHNEKRAQLLRKELQLLAEQEIGTFKDIVRDVTKPLRRVPNLEDIRQSAADAVSQQVVRNISPIGYLRAEQTASRNAVELFLNGDISGAFDAKMRELLNHELYRAAIAASDEVEKIRDFAAKFDDDKYRARLGRAGHDYLEQIDGIRERFEFSRQSGPALDKRQSLREFMDDQKANGYEPQVPDKLLNEAYHRNYQELRVDELRDLGAAMRSIYKLATTKNALLASARKRNFDAAREEIVTEIKANHKIKVEPLDLAPDMKKRIVAGVRGFMAAHNKAEFIFEWLDGYKELGTNWTYFFKPLADAEGQEGRMMHEAVLKSHQIFGAYTREERSTWLWKKKEFTMGGKPMGLTKSNIMAIALNWGNDYNRDALVRGYEKFGWTEGDIQTVLDSLDERDWQTVQAVWDWFESFRPQVGALQRQVTGLEPEWVKPAQVNTKHGSFRGGYYPIAFDAKLSLKQMALDLKQQVRDMYGGQFAMAMTKHGHTEARNNTGGKPLRLELSVATDHVTNVIHDLTHRRAVMDVNRLIEDPEIRQTMEQTIGADLQRQLRPWLMNIARPVRGDFINPIEGIMSRARTGATIVNLGWKFTTALTQFLGFTGTVNEIGAEYSARGIASVYGEPWKAANTWKFVAARSEFMHERLRNYDRDVNDALQSLQVSGTSGGRLSTLAAMAHPLRDTFFQMIGVMDMAVSLPSWMGAYQKALDGKVDNVPKGNETSAIDYADKVVRQTQGVGSAKDLATVQRGPNTVKLFTMFYTYFGGLFNQFTKETRRVQKTGDVGKFAVAATFLWLVPAVLGEALLGRMPSTDDDPEKWIKWFLGAELTYPFQSVIIVRDVINGMRYNGYEPSAAFDQFKAFTDAGKMLTEQVANLVSSDGKEVTRAQAKATAQAVGYATHIPSRQLWLTMEYFYDWMTGMEDPDNPAEGLFHAFVTGKPKQE